MVVTNEEKKAAYYYGSNYYIPYVYSALQANKSYLMSPINHSLNQKLIVSLNDNSYEMDVPAMTIDDDGYRDFTYIGFDCDIGAIKKGKADSDDCYLTHKLTS